MSERRRALLGVVAGAVAGSSGLAFGQTVDPGDVGVVRPTPPSPVVKAASRAHLEAAQRAAGTEFTSALLLCNLALPEGQKIPNIPPAVEMRAQGGVAGQPPAPTKVFDNLYYLGIRHVTAWAIDTPEGIILIDALNNRADIEQAVEGGMRTLGLDPARIRYVIVTHGHPDHYGGAQYLADKYKARVLLSAYDWALADALGQTQMTRPDFGPPPKRDMVVTDGQTLTLGGQSVTMHITPGHTPGTISLVFPVTDKGQKHVVALWGGTGFNFRPSIPRFRQYSESAERFSRLAVGAGADVMLSNHPENDNSIKLNDRLAVRTAGAPHPYVVGPDAVRRFLTAYSECAQTFRSQMEP